MVAVDVMVFASADPDEAFRTTDHLPRPDP